MDRGKKKDGPMAISFCIFFFLGVRERHHDMADITLIFSIRHSYSQHLGMMGKRDIALHLPDRQGNDEKRMKKKFDTRKSEKHSFLPSCIILGARVWMGTGVWQEPIVHKKKKKALGFIVTAFGFSPSPRCIWPQSDLKGKRRGGVSCFDGSVLVFLSYGGVLQPKATVNLLFAHVMGS